MVLLKPISLGCQASNMNGNLLLGKAHYIYLLKVHYLSFLSDTNLLLLVRHEFKGKLQKGIQILCL
jgi:hypothetical protein